MPQRDDIQRLLINHYRRLQALKEKKAQYGLETPVAILTEIEDIQAEIETLEAELEALDDDTEKPVLPSNRSYENPSIVPAVGGVQIGNVSGGIRNATIVGGNYNETVIEQVEDIRKGKKELHERQEFLLRLKRIYINALEKLIPNSTPKHPILELRPDAVEHPWDMVVDTSDRVKTLLPAGTQLVDFFAKDDMEKSFLILGEPGVGKTTQLLHLARQAIAWAEQDSDYPIPVILDLTGWANSKQSLADWIITVLTTKYYAKPKAAQTWFKHNELFLLLDGLDEVQPLKHREKCVQTINAFYQECSLMPLVVCCCREAYEALKTRLQLEAAIYMQPTHT